jgi:hypothetical protein
MARVAQIGCSAQLVFRTRVSTAKAASRAICLPRIGPKLPGIAGSRALAAGGRDLLSRKDLLSARGLVPSIR